MKKEPAKNTIKSMFAKYMNGLEVRTTHKVLKKNLNLFQYKIHALQHVNVCTANQRHIFANDLLKEIDCHEIDVGTICFSNEDYFYVAAL